MMADVRPEPVGLSPAAPGYRLLDLELTFRGVRAHCQ